MDLIQWWWGPLEAIVDFGGWIVVLGALALWGWIFPARFLSDSRCHSAHCRGFPVAILNELLTFHQRGAALSIVKHAAAICNEDACPVLRWFADRTLARIHIVEALIAHESPSPSIELANRAVDSARCVKDDCRRLCMQRGSDHQVPGSIRAPLGRRRGGGGR